RVGVTGGDGQQGRGDSRAHEGDTVAAEALIDAGLDRDVVAGGDVLQAGDDASVVVDERILVDDGRAAAELDGEFVLVGAGVVGDRAVVDGDREVEAVWRAERGGADQADFFLHGGGDREFVGQVAAGDLGDEMGHQGE